MLLNINIKTTFLTEGTKLLEKRILHFATVLWNKGYWVQSVILTQQISVACWICPRPRSYVFNPLCGFTDVGCRI